MMCVVMTFTLVTRHQMSSVSSNLRQNPSRGEVGDDLSYLDILCCCRGGHGSCHAQSDPLHPVTHHRSQTFRNVHIPHLYEVIWEECAAERKLVIVQIVQTVHLSPPSGPCN